MFFPGLTTFLISVTKENMSLQSWISSHTSFRNLEWALKLFYKMEPENNPFPLFEDLGKVAYIYG